jgi:histone-lysine N-methyltransferase SETMAR
VYNNVERKRSWGRQGERPLLTPKAELHQKKVMLCIWWDWKEILYYDLLPRNQTINSDVYCSQLDRLKAAIDQERPELVNRESVAFHHDNARPHVSLATLQKLMQLGWDVLPHPPYSPGLRLTFISVPATVNGKNCTSPEVCKNYLEQSFGRKTRKFYMDGIMKLPESWLKVIEKKWCIH